MKSQPERYRGFDIVKLFGETFVVLTWRGEKLSSHSSLPEAKAEIDRLLLGPNRTDASGYGCPI